MSIFLKFTKWLESKASPKSKAAFDSGSFYAAGMHHRNDVTIDPVQMMLLDRGLNPESTELKNIAVTGPYGSGKSSLVHSYLTSRNLPCATVTLAAFNDLPTLSSNGSNNNCHGMDPIEKKIVDQLAARVHKRRGGWSFTSFPSSDVSRRQRALQLAFLILAMLTAAVISIDAIAIPNIAAETFNQFAFIVSSSLAVVIAWMIFFAVFMVSGCPPLIKQLAISNTQATLDSDLIKYSYFDRNIALILQIIDDLDADVIVFEDIDRLNKPDLFTKLRELNQVANSHVGPGRTIKFVYCLHDTVFKGKERVKFFDLIIPVVPVLDGFNSLSALNEELGDPYCNELNERFRRNVAIYLDDYRLIKNTVVEYKVYYSKLDAKNHQELVKENLFAIIALKNLHAESFFGLETRTGKLYEYLSPFEKDPSEENPDNSNIKDAAHSLIEGAESIEILRARDFLIYIVEGGYLDSNFFCYISLPDPSIISPNDRIWLLNARKGVQDIGYHLQSPSEILLMSESDAFSKKSFLNVSLLEYTLNHKRLSTVAEKMIQEGKLSSPEFVAQATKEIPAFAYLACKQDRDYFKNRNNVGLELPIALSIICHADPNSLDEMDNALEGTIAIALSKNIGKANGKCIERMKQSSPDAVKKTIQAMLHYGSRCEAIEDDIDPELFDAILENELLAFNEGNIEKALILARSAKIEIDPLDRVREARHGITAKIWGQICAYPTRFIDEYIGEHKVIRCSPDCFIELLNSFDPTNTRSAATLIESFDGTIDDVASIKERNLWPFLEANHRIKGTIQNALKCLEEHGPTEEWTSFVNDSTWSKSEIKTVDDNGITLVRNEMPSFFNLNNERFGDFCELSGPNSIFNMNGNIGTKKANYMLSNDALILSCDTLALARNASEATKIAYFLRHLGQYCEAVSQSNSRDNTEAIQILDSIEDVKMMHTFSDCISGNLDSSKLNISPSTLGKLLYINKIEDPANIVNKYGNDSVLDSFIEEYTCRQSEETLNSLEIPIELALKTIKRAKDDQAKAFCMSIVSNSNDRATILAGLTALGSETLLGLADNKQPLIRSLTAVEESVANDLIRKGWITKGPNNGRLYGRKLRRM